jgi:hypothetical protein
VPEFSTKYRYGYCLFSSPSGFFVIFYAISSVPCSLSVYEKKVRHKMGMAIPCITGDTSGVQEKHLDSVVEEVCHIHAARGGVHGYTSWTEKLAVAETCGSKLCYEVAAGVEHLYAAVAGVSHKHAARHRVHRDSSLRARYYDGSFSVLRLTDIK